MRRAIIEKNRANVERPSLVDYYRDFGVLQMNLGDPGSAKHTLSAGLAGAGDDPTLAVPRAGLLHDHAHAAEAALALRKVKRAAHKTSTSAARSADTTATPAPRAAATPVADTTPTPMRQASGTASAPGTYAGYVTSSLNAGVLLRGRLVLVGSGDLEYTGTNGRFAGH